MGRPDHDAGRGPAFDLWRSNPTERQPKNATASSSGASPCVNIPPRNQERGLEKEKTAGVCSRQRTSSLAVSNLAKCEISPSRRGPFAFHARPRDHLAEVQVRPQTDSDSDGLRSSSPGRSGSKFLSRIQDADFLSRSSPHECKTEERRAGVLGANEGSSSFPNDESMKQFRSVLPRSNAAAVVAASTRNGATASTSDVGAEEFVNNVDSASVKANADQSPRRAKVPGATALDIKAAEAARQAKNLSGALLKPQAIASSAAHQRACLGDSISPRLRRRSTPTAPTGCASELVSIAENESEKIPEGLSRTEILQRVSADVSRGVAIPAFEALEKNTLPDACDAADGSNRHDLQMRRFLGLQVPGKPQNTKAGSSSSSRVALHGPPLASGATTEQGSAVDGSFSRTCQKQGVAQNDYGLLQFGEKLKQASAAKFSLVQDVSATGGERVLIRSRNSKYSTFDTLCTFDGSRFSEEDADYLGTVESLRRLPVFALESLHQAANRKHSGAVPAADKEAASHDRTGKTSSSQRNNVKAHEPQVKSPGLVERILQARDRQRPGLQTGTSQQQASPSTGPASTGRPEQENKDDRQRAPVRATSDTTPKAILEPSEFGREIPTSADVLAALYNMRGADIAGEHELGFLVRLISLLHTWSYKGAHELMLSKGLDFLFERSAQDQTPRNDLLVAAAHHLQGLMATVLDPKAARKKMQSRAMEHYATQEAARVARKKAKLFVAESREQLGIVESYTDAMEQGRFQSMAVEKGRLLYENTAAAAAAAVATAGEAQQAEEVDFGGRPFYVDRDELNAADIAYFNGSRAQVDLARVRMRWWDKSADLEALDKMMRRLVFPIKCDACGETIALCKKSILGGHDYPQMFYQVVLRDKDTGELSLTFPPSSRSIGQRSHYLACRNTPDRCFCGWWLDNICFQEYRESIRDMQKVGESSWWNCAFYQISIHAHMYPGSACRCHNYVPPRMDRATPRWNDSRAADKIFGAGASQTEADSLTCVEADD
ncbi:unnamed protein product [Amoebophrya sp. A25]|nr:unnamed protein product [Amoebophrya sp. A25]|eukprot:GSA25T00019661001.1